MPAPSVVDNRHPEPAADVRPDIIAITVDDLGYLPDERVLERLPAINALFLEGGLRFTNAYGETPLCSPGRASFLTGQHTRRHGVVRNDPRLFDPSHTVATMLRKVGYATGMFCTKYLNRADLLTDHKPPGWDRVAMALGNTLSDSDWWMDDRAVHRGLPATSVIGIQAAKWMPPCPGRPLALIGAGPASRRIQGVPARCPGHRPGRPPLRRHRVLRAAQLRLRHVPGRLAADGGLRIAPPGRQAGGPGAGCGGGPGPPGRLDLHQRQRHELGSARLSAEERPVGEAAPDVRRRHRHHPGHDRGSRCRTSTWCRPSRTARWREPLFR